MSRRFICCLLSSVSCLLAGELIYPNGLAIDKQGNLYVSDIGTNRVLKMASDGKTSLVAGTGQSGFHGDGGPAANAKLFAPHDIIFDSQGNLLIADSLNHRIRRIDSKGIISTIAGTGVSGYAGDGGPAVQAQLNGPQGLTFDRNGDLLVADTYNHAVRRIDREGVITTIAGPGPGLSGDGGPATKAQISLPSDLAVAPDGVLYIAELGNSRIRRVGSDGLLQTLSGFGIGSGAGGAGFSGDNGPPEKARLFSPAGLYCDSSGALFISDTGNNRIRVIRDGRIDTIAGGGTKDVNLNTPQKIRPGPGGRLYIADRGNGRVRVIEPSGAIRDVAGTGETKGITLSLPEKR